MELAIRRLDDFTEDNYAAGYAMLSAGKRRRVDRMHAEADRQRSIAGDFLARELLSRATGISPSELVIETTENGKPFISVPGIHFSIAHAHRLVVCALDEMPVGVDVERLRRLSQSLVNRFFSPAEAAYAQSDTSGLHAMQLWTRKEAYTKMLGGSILLEGRLELRPVDGKLPDTVAGCIFENRRPGPDYVIGLCRRL